ncbi:MAG: Ig-like domain-containing protein [Clostridia bacterium]|nr:Ig-like domain-containing protein [Clostridia bacterium]
MLKKSAWIALPLAICLLLSSCAILTDTPARPTGTTSTPTSAAPTSTASEPAQTEPSLTEPSASEPAQTEPSSTEPSASEPAQTEPSSTEPSATQKPTETTTGTAKSTDPSVPSPQTTGTQSIKVSSVTVSAARTTLNVGDTLQLSVSVTPADAQDKSVTWSVAAGADCAKVSAKGVVTGLKAGSCTVRAQANDGSGKAGTIQLTIKASSGLTGSGTSSDPYLIQNKDDLVHISTLLGQAGLYFKQTADIDLSAAVWTPIGSDAKPFRHHYNGNGYRIIGLTVSGSDTGLFGYARDASLTGVTITGFQTAGSEGGSRVGGLVSRARNARIDRCSVSGEMNGGDGCGLLAGTVYGCLGNGDSITDCAVSGVIRGGNHTGGLIGRVCKDDDAGDGDYDYEDLTLTVSGCTARIDMQNCNGEDIGGLIGYVECATVKQCRAQGQITSSSGNMRGGLIGEVYEKSQVFQCSADVDITATGSAYGDAFCGGLIGYMLSRCEVHDCYATGDISCAGTWSDCQDKTTYNGGLWMRYYNPCGALIGCIFTVSESEPITLYNCYATGTVTQAAPCVTDNIDCAGSLVGLMFDTATVRYMIKDEYRVKSTRDIVESKHIDITGDMMKGSMVRRMEHNYCVSTRREFYTPINYIVRNKNQTTYVGQYKSLPSYRVVTNVGADAVHNQSTFQGFDFSNVWKMGADGPELR